MFNQNTESHLQRGTQLLNIWQDGFYWSSTNANLNESCIWWSINPSTQKCVPTCIATTSLFCEYRACNVELILGYFLDTIIMDQYYSMILWIKILSKVHVLRRSQSCKEEVKIRKNMNQYKIMWVMAIHYKHLYFIKLKQIKQIHFLSPALRYKYIFLIIISTVTCFCVAIH